MEPETTVHPTALGTTDAAASTDDPSESSLPADKGSTVRDVGDNAREDEPEAALHAETTEPAATAATDPDGAIRTVAKPRRDDDQEPHSTDATNRTTVLPQKPVKRARTAYFIFADDHRARVQKEHPGEGVATQAKALGHLWANLPADAKLVYQNQAAQERERVAQQLQAWKDAGGLATATTNTGLGANSSLLESSSPANNNADSLVFPVARVRKICKLDTDVKGLSKEALLLVTKAAELFTSQLGTETTRVAQIQNRRTLLPDDVAQVCATRARFDFLQPDIQDLTRQQQTQARVHQQEKAAAAGEVATGRANGKNITDYFAAVPQPE
jgi:DNA-directed RNA polymerase I subunit RPA43